MIVRAASDEDIRAVIGALRPHDRLEQYATRFNEDPDAFAGELIGARPLAILQEALCQDDGAPAALIGVYVAGPELATLHQAATDRFEKIAGAATRYYLRRIPIIFGGLRRVECRILANDLRTQRWLKHLGFQVEGVARAFGKAGEDFLHVAWTRG